MKKTTKDSIIIGFALFAIFFGAGNLIFPPTLGNLVGKEFLISSFGFTLAAVGLPLLGILASLKCDGDFQKVFNVMGNRFSIIISVMLFLAIGPMVAIPRTAATTYELTLYPIFPHVTPLVGMIIYFIINLILVFKPSKIMDGIGKVLTPILLICLGTIIIKGIIFPIGTPSISSISNIFSTSFVEGYQTMDALGSLVFASIVLTSIKAKGYDKNDSFKIAIKASIVAIIGLSLVYFGLMYLGSQTSALIPSNIGKTSLLIEITNRILGSFGCNLLGLAIGLACLTTSIGLISSGASFFEKLTKGKLNYKFNAIIITVISIIIGQFGVDKIVAIANPILSILYPIGITIIITTFIRYKIQDTLPIKVAVYTSLIFSILSGLPSFGININSLNNLLNFIPLSSLGFSWLLPTIISFIITFVMIQLKPQVKVDNEI